MTEREAIVAEARSYLGTPWVHMGRQPGLAIDCAGVWICVCRARAYLAATFDVPAYTQEPDGQLVRLCERYMGARVPQQSLRPGDGVVIATATDPQHLGIVGDYRHSGLSIIHASNALSVQPGRVIETRLMFSRAMRFVTAYRFPGVA